MNLVEREHYTEAPPVEVPGQPRYFDRDDMVAFVVLDHCHGCTGR